MTDILPKVEPQVEKKLDDEEMDAWMNEAPARGATEAERNTYAELRASAARLGTSLKNIGVAVDQKLHITETAKKIDESTHISAAVGQGVQKVGKVLGTIDRQYQVKETTVQTARTIDEKLKISQVAANAGTAIKEFDEKNRLTTRTVKVLADGAGFVEKKVAGTVPPEPIQPSAETELTAKADVKVD